MNHNMVKGTLALLIVAFAVAASGCATVVRTSRLKPAEINLGGMKRLAIGDVKGQRSEQVTNALNAAIAATGRFEVIDRSNLGAVAAEQRLAASGAAASEGSPAAGQLSTAQGLVFANVPQCGFTENVTSKQDTCSRYEGSGKQRKEIKYACTRYDRQMNARCSMAFDIVDVATSKKVATRNYDQTSKDSTTSYDEQPKAIDGEGHVAGLIEGEIGSFMKAIAPHQVSVEVQLEDDDDVPELARGNAFAGRGDWAAATEQYGQAVARLEGSPTAKRELLGKAKYNLGIALGFSGKYEDGIAQIKKGFELTGDQDYLTWTSNLKQYMAEDAKLNAQLQAAGQAPAAPGAAPGATP